MSLGTIKIKEYHYLMSKLWLLAIVVLFIVTGTSIIKIVVKFLRKRDLEYRRNIVKVG